MVSWVCNQMRNAFSAASAMGIIREHCIMRQAGGARAHDKTLMAGFPMISSHKRWHGRYEAPIQMASSKIHAPMSALISGGPVLHTKLIWQKASMPVSSCMDYLQFVSMTLQTGKTHAIRLT